MSSAGIWTVAPACWARLIAASQSSTLVEGARVVDRGVHGERAETGVQMVVTRLDQLQWHHSAGKQFPQFLASANVAADSVAGEERVAAEQCIARPFKTHLGFQSVNPVTVIGKPPVIQRLLPLSLGAPEAGQDGKIVPDKRGIGRKNHIRQACRRAQARDDCPASLE